MRVRVCRVDEVGPGQMRAFDVAALSVPILIANLDGVFLAASGMCPHEDVELIDGDIDGDVITCPGHAYQFSLRSGACDHDPELCLPTYRVSVENDDVFVSLLARAC